MIDYNQAPQPYVIGSNNPENAAISLHKMFPDSMPGMFGDKYICDLLPREAIVAEQEIPGLRLRLLPPEEFGAYGGTDTDPFRY